MQSLHYDWPITSDLALPLLYELCNLQFSISIISLSHHIQACISEARHRSCLDFPEFAPMYADLPTSTAPWTLAVATLSARLPGEIVHSCHKFLRFFVSSYFFLSLWPKSAFVTIFV